MPEQSIRVPSARPSALRLVWSGQAVPLQSPCLRRRASLELRGVTAAPGEVRAGFLSQVLAALPPGQTLEFRHSLALDRHAKHYTLQVDLLDEGPGERALYDPVGSDLVASLPWLWLEPTSSTTDATEHDLPWRRTLRPAGLRLWPGKEAARGGQQRDLPVEVVPYPATLPSWPLTAPLDDELIGVEHLQIVQRVRAFTLTPEDIAKTHSLLQRVRAGSLRCYQPGSPLAPFTADPDLRDPVRDLLQRWLVVPGGYSFEVELASSCALSSATLGRMARDIFGAMPFNVLEEAPALIGADAWPHAVLPQQGTPALLPGRAAARAAGTRQFYGPAGALPAEGILIGDSAAGRRNAPVRLQPGASTRHTAIMGASGAGKSTLMLRMIAELLNDPNRTCGIGILDPHGELAERVMSLVPASAAKDLVLIDVTDTESCACVNPLQGMRDNPVHANFVASQMVEIVEMLFDTKDTTGPMLRSNLKNLLLLAGMRPGIQGTLLDAVRMIDDSDFLDWVLTKSAPSEVVSYWRRFMRTSGDNSYNNWLPYIQARLGPFTANPVLKRLLCRPQSTVDLRNAMDERKIVICNFSKSVLQDAECRAVGALFLTMFQAAAMARPRATSMAHPFNLYIDEFQSLVSDSVGRLFAESRKYGLALCCANQNPSQLRGRQGGNAVLDAVLGNTATKFLFRTGPGDSALLGPLYRSAVDDEEMACLPDFHAVASITNGSDRLAPFVMRVAQPQPLPEPNCMDTLRREASTRHGTTMAAANAELMQLYDLPRSALCPYGT